MKKIFIFLFFSFILLSEDKDKTLKISINSNPLVDLLKKHITNSRIHTILFEGLLVYSKSGIKKIPALCQSWTISDDRKTYTFKLKDDIKYSNGSNISANDFRDFFLYIGSPKTKSEYAYMLDIIEGYKDYRTSKVKTQKVVGIKVDGRNLIFKLKHPSNYFLKILANPVFSLVNIPNLKSGFKGGVISSGPYILKKVDVKNQKIIFKKNVNYWDKDNVDLDYISFIIKSYKNSMKLIGDFNSGMYDWIMYPDNMNLDLVGNRNIVVSTTFDSSFFYFLFKRNKALENKNVTEALIKMLPISKFRSGYFSSSYFLPFIPYFKNKESIVKKDEKEAQKLLEEAGYKNGKGIELIKILLPKYDEFKEFGKIIQKAWEKLDFKVEISFVEDDDIESEKRKNQYDFTYASWIGDYLDPMSFLELFISNSDFGSGFSSKEYDDFIKKSFYTKNEDKRYEILELAESYLLKKGVVFPISANQFSMDIINTNKVKNYKKNPSDILYFKYIEYQGYSLPPNIA